MVTDASILQRVEALTSYLNTAVPRVEQPQYRILLTIILALVLLFAGATYMLANQLRRSDRTLEVLTHAGTVTGITRAGPRSAIAHVHLDDKIFF